MSFQAAVYSFDETSSVVKKKKEEKKREERMEYPPLTSRR